MLPSSTHPFPPFLPCHKAESPENQLEGLGSTVSSPMGSMAKPNKRILVYFELENCTWQQHFWLFILASNGAP